MASLHVEEERLPASRSHVAMASVMARILSGSRAGARENSEEEDDEISAASKPQTKKLKYSPESRSQPPVQQMARSGGKESSSRDEKTTTGDDDCAVRHSGQAAVDVVRLCHKSPVDSSVEEERLLQTMATKGVVQLFNAVRKQQKIIEKKTKEAGNSERKKSKVLNSIDKGSFIDMLKGGVTASTKQKNNKLKSSDHKETGSTWSILKDDYMKSSSVMEDWASDDDQEFSDQEVSSDSDSI